MRLLLYGSLSVSVAGLAVWSAYSQHQQFFPTAIHLAKSSASSMVCREAGGG